MKKIPDLFNSSGGFDEDPQPFSGDVKKMANEEGGALDLRSEGRGNFISFLILVGQPLSEMPNIYFDLNK